MKASNAVSLVFLIILFLCSVDTQPVKPQSSGTIYVRSDGSVEGTDKIQRDGNVYTLTSDIFGSIVVERDNIVVDGVGYTLQGTRSETGISLTGRTNVTIKNMQIRYFSIGIALDSSYHNAISGNNITHNGYQASIFLFGKSSNNKINNNNIEANDVNGIWLNYSSDNTISENRIKANGFEGIMVSGGSNNRISGNVIEKNDGDGIYLSADSSGTTVTENNITENNPNGILLMYSSGNTISKNNLENNYRGVYVDASPNNTLVGNNIKGNGRAGIEAITTSSNNKIYHNNFVDNAKQVLSTDSIGVWDNGKEGNYWSDYNGTDNNRDGIGDTPHIINERNQDNYPLMNNWVRVTQQSEPTTAPPTQWNKGYTELHGTGNCAIQTSDGGYAIAGVSYGKFLLVKASSTGDVQWWKTYQDGEAYSIVQTSDGGYAIAGSGTLFSFVKTDSAGNMQWNKDYSKLGLPFLAKSLIQTSDGGYALSGWTSDGDWTIKTDSNGNMQWNKTYGTERAQSFVTAIVEADDGGYALTGNNMLIKIDSSGNVQWNRTYEFVSSLAKTKDSGYLLVGSAVVGSAWLVKTDSQGNMQWTNKYGINGTMNFNVLSSAVQTRDGGYVVAGTTYPIYDGLAWIVKTSANGNMEWNAIYEPVKGSNSIAKWIIETNDGGYVFTGSKGVGRGYTDPGDVWLVKIATTIPEPFSTLIVAAIVTIAVVGAALLIYFAKVKKTTEKSEGQQVSNVKTNTCIRCTYGCHRHLQTKHVCTKQNFLPEPNDSSFLFHGA